MCPKQQNDPHAISLDCQHKAGRIHWFIVLMKKCEPPTCSLNRNPDSSDDCIVRIEHLKTSSFDFWGGIMGAKEGKLWTQHGNIVTFLDWLWRDEILSGYRATLSFILSNRVRYSLSVNSVSLVFLLFGACCGLEWNKLWAGQQLAKSSVKLIGFNNSSL